MANLNNMIKLYLQYNKIIFRIKKPYPLCYELSGLLKLPL